MEIKEIMNKLKDDYQEKYDLDYNSAEYKIIKSFTEFIIKSDLSYKAVNYQNNKRNDLKRLKQIKLKEPKIIKPLKLPKEPKEPKQPRIKQLKTSRPLVKIEENYDSKTISF